MRQTVYSQQTPRGVAGGLVDLSTHVIDTRLNGESGTVLKFGMGVVQGTTPGSNIKVPVVGTTAEKFEGITVNGYTNEMDMTGAISVAPTASIGVMRYGKIWARIKPGITPAYGEVLYLVISGDAAGTFTNAADADAIAIKGRFIGSRGTGDVAPVELYNQENTTAAQPGA